MAQAKAQALAAKLQRGDDCEEDTEAFLKLGVGVPDGLLLAALGDRQQEIKACPKALKLLLDAKGNPNALDQMDMPMIHTACWRSSGDAVKLLLEYRADMEAPEKRFHTPPLNTAIAAGNAKACLELLNRNCDVTWKHHDGASALHVATAWIASSHNANMRIPPVGEEPCAVIQMMLHNGVDPTQTEGMSKGTNRAEGMTPLESFRREIARSPWRTHETIGPKFDKTAKNIHVLLEQGESAVKEKEIGNKAYKEKRNADALKAWKRAREIWEKAEVRGHHTAVLWNNEATCRRNTGDLEGCKAACREGMTHYASKAIRDKLQFNLTEAEKPPPEPTEEEVKKQEEVIEARKEKAKQQKEEKKEITKKAVLSDGGIYGDEGSGQKDYVMPGPFICPMPEAQKMGLGPPPEPKPWWEKKDADSDEEPERTTIGYLPAHHPKW